MGLLSHLRNLRRQCWIKRKACVRLDETDRLRTRRFEPMEPRRMLDANPLFLGAVYIEEDTGSDLHGDTFEITFEGGAPGTQLTHLRIDGDQTGNFGNLPGFSSGDVFFDTVESLPTPSNSGLGADEAFPFQLMHVLDRNGNIKTNVSLDVHVVDGTSLLEIDLVGFVAGDRLVFSIDVDEVEVFDPRFTDIRQINDGFDPLTSGAEFHGTILTATFVAPHYYEAQQSSTFLNRYDSSFDEVERVLGNGNSLQLPADAENGTDRTAGALVRVDQEALPVTISGTVFHDRDLDLRQQASLQEEGIAGVQLSLWIQQADGTYRAAVDEHGQPITTVTNSRGDYLFGTQWDLKPGVYQVRQQQPAGYPISVGAIAGSVGSVATGSSSGTNILTGIAIPLGGTAAVRYNFAEARPSSLSGYVYHDRDNDGRRDPGEQGIAGVKVEAIDQQGNVVASALTNADGFYQIGGLAPGRYRLQETQPAGWIDGQDTAGTIQRLGAGTVVVGTPANPGNSIADVQLRSDEQGINYNFGERLGSIAGMVYWDANENCVVDNGESGIANVTIILVDQSGNHWTTTTDASGRYRFDDVKAGTYTVRQEQPDDFFHGGQVVGSGTGNASVANQISGIVVGAGDQIQLRDYNFCETRGSISGYVYHDRDNDGLREPGQGEEAIAGVTVRLFDARTGQPALDDQGRQLITTTNSQGFYQFTALRPGMYRVVQQQLSGWIDGRDTAGTVDGKNSGRADSQGDYIDQIDLSLTTPSQARKQGINYNFGERLGSIEGFVYWDANQNCVFETSEVGIEGVQITLRDQAGNTWTTLTDETGRYVFSGLGAGTYQLTETQPTDFFHGGQLVGNGVGDASVANQISGILIGTGDRVFLSGYDFCETRATISGFVYHDRDNDGVREPGQGESPIAGVTVRLHYAETGNPVLDSQGNPLVSVTNASGQYRFEGLAPGLYRVVEQHPANWIDGRETAGTVDGVVTGVAGSSGDQIDQIDLRQKSPSQTSPTGIDFNFGERLGSIAGTVHVDHDDDCLFDPGEPGLAGVLITLIDQDGNRRTTTTDANGRYRFDNLQVGVYSVVEQQPQEYFDLGHHAGTGGGDASLPNVISGIRIGGTAVELRDYSFCEAEGTLSGHVFHDADNDGRREAGEQPIAGVMVSLLDAGGRPVLGPGGQPLTQQTDQHGFYQFTGLSPGIYRIVETQPASWLDGLDSPGTVGGNPTGQVLPGGDQIGQIDLTGALGRDGIDFDFGELLPATIAGTVHSDLNNNCLYEPELIVYSDEPDVRETGLAGVEVQLLDQQGAVVATTTTDADGNYRFDGVRPGVYSVRESQPAGYFQGGQRAGTGGGNDLTDDMISNITVHSGMDLAGYDFCEHPPVEISGLVFQDGPVIIQDTPGPIVDLHLIRDGVFDSTDTPISGVILELRDGITGLPIDASVALPGTYAAGPIRTRTNASGQYEFVNLPAGVYSVFQVHPGGYIDGIDTRGTRAEFAVNAHLPLPAAVLAALKADHHNDAILRIAVPHGTHSVDNHFSEVLRTVQVGFIPFAPPAVRQEPAVRIENPLTPPDTPTPPLPLRQQAALPGFTSTLMFSWHLSVIDGGRPRGVGPSSTDPQSIHSASHMTAANWDLRQLAYGRWIVPNLSGTSEALELQQFAFGTEDATPVVGDFNGDGISEFGVFHDGEWFIDLNGNGRWDLDDLWAQLGDVGDRPVTGDWDGDGKDDIGIYGPAWPGDPEAIAAEPGLPDPSNHPVTSPKNVPPRPGEAPMGARVLQLTKRGDQRADVIDHVFRYGATADIPVAGDWNGDGIHTIGVFRDGRWHLDRDGNGKWTSTDTIVQFGQKGDVPVVGDFNGDGVDDLGVFRAGTWMLDINGNRELDAHDKVFQLGDADDLPIVGDFNGDGIDEPGLYRNVPGPDQDRISRVPEP